MRLSRALCAAVADTLVGSHASLEAFFQSCGVKCEAPALSHGAKWKEWLFRVGQEQPDESITILGSLLEEFMDVQPPGDFLDDAYENWEAKRNAVNRALEDSGLRYFRFGRVLPQGQTPDDSPAVAVKHVGPARPKDVETLLDVIIRGLRRSMHPLTHRRKGSTPLTFHSEYDVQDLLHALLRPWINDIRPEEFTPSYAGSSTRMDFLLPAHELVIETKIVRDRAHAKTIGNELIIDIDHYRKHPGCKRLWCVIYDPEHYLTNADGLKNDLEGERKTKDGAVDVKLNLVPSAGEAIVSALTLESRDSWLTLPVGYDERDRQPWRFRRRLSAVRKPLLQITHDADPMMLVAPGMVRESFAYCVSNYHEGNFPDWQLRPAMQAFFGYSRHKRGREFNGLVAKRLADLGWCVECEIKLTKILSRNLGRDWGDVDVLAWNRTTKRLLVIECKDVQFRKTLGEIAEQLSDFRGELRPNGKPDLLKKHLNRVDQLRANMAKLKEFVQMPNLALIESHLVFKNPVPMQHATQHLEQTVHVSTYDDLAQI